MGGALTTGADQEVGWRPPGSTPGCRGRRWGLVFVLVLLLVVDVVRGFNEVEEDPTEYYVTGPERYVALSSDMDVFFALPASSRDEVLARVMDERGECYVLNQD